MCVFVCLCVSLNEDVGIVIIVGDHSLHKCFKKSGDNDFYFDGVYVLQFKIILENEQNYLLKKMNY